MNLNRVLRPALKILTTTLVTVVTVAGVTSGQSTSTAAPAKASSVKLVMLYWAHRMCATGT